MSSSQPAAGAADPAAPAPDAEAGRKKKTRNLILRGVSALAALGLIYWSLRWDAVNGMAVMSALLLALVSLWCLREFYRLAVDCGMRPFRWLGYAAGPAWILALEWELSGGSGEYLAAGPAGLVLLFVVVAALLLQLTRKTNDNALIDVSVTVFGVVYCAVLPGAILHLRHMGYGESGWPMHGIEFAVVCIFVAKVSDVGALLTGSRWGKRKLIPRLSPGKTWEGAFGGLVFSILLLQLMVATCPAMALAALGTLEQVLLSVLLAAGGLAGDLIESSFKRNSRRKDAGTGVPGFGGVLDLMDSLMVAGPVMYFFLLATGAGYV